MSAFANCGRAVAHVRGSYVPMDCAILLAKAVPARFDRGEGIPKGLRMNESRALILRCGGGRCRSPILVICGNV